MESKKFKSIAGQPIRIALLDGHVTWVAEDWTELHPRFHSAAYSSGCVSQDMYRNSQLSESDARVANTMQNVMLQKKEVEDAIRKLIDENNLEAFDNKNGKPKSNTLTEMVGFRVTNAMRDEVWYFVQESMNDAS
ncbi:MAG: hypothetical protein H6961_07120 [Chromatiaceae bacterium]|nr:hypothetical protein [Chromatiaceae bacterium]